MRMLVRLVPCVLAIVSVLSAPAVAAPMPGHVARPALVRAEPAPPTYAPGRHRLLLRLADQEGIRAARALSGPLGVPPLRLRLPGGVSVSLEGNGRDALRVAKVIRAAVAAIGTPYVWGGTSPGVGLDCSGLTLTAWAAGGVALPHNSGAQRAALPAVAREDLRPGDLLFFYSPVSHVALYVGRGLMIDAVTSRSQVVLQPVWWDSYVGAARPFGPVG